MTTVINDFEKRASEIKLYFKLLERVVEEEACLYLPEKRTHKYIEFDSELQKVMKTNMFLLLYNLAESSIKQSLSEVYDTVSAESVKYNDVKEEIQKIWIDTNYKNFNQMGTNRIHEVINNILEDVIEVEFDASKKISGNIDGRKIKEFAEQIGFSTKAHHSLNEGVRLHQVKTQRNKLAHGDLSFAECGRNYTIPDLRVLQSSCQIFETNIVEY